MCAAAHMVTHSADRMDILNKPVIAWWVCAGMSHSSVVEPLLLPDEFPSCCLTNRGSTSSSAPPPLPPLLSKTSIGSRGGMEQREKWRTARD